MLKEYIKSSGKSQRVWARELAVAESHLSALMNGKKVPSLDLAVRIQRQTSGAVSAESWVKRGNDGAAPRGSDEAAQTPTPQEDAA
jgi:plasmid maintenance system antidote protein VapI